jgi:hypothetical protein
VTGDDAVEFRQRLHLVDNDTAHLGHAFGSLFRQFEHPAAQLAARRLELALHVERHLLHALHDLGESIGRLLQQVVGLAGVLLKQTLGLQ